MWAEPRCPNAQYIGAGEGFIYSIDVVPRYARALVTQEPNFSFSGLPIEIAFGPIAVGLAVVAFQPMLLGGLGCFIIPVEG